MGAIAIGHAARGVLGTIDASLPVDRVTAALVDAIERSRSKA